MPETYEKRCERIPLHCSNRERELWLEAFPRGVSSTGRALLNQAAEKKLGRSLFKSG